MPNNTIWYTIGPFAAAQTIELNTIGSNFNTTLQVLTGACGAQTQVACYQGQGASFQSLLSFQAAPATVYYIQAGGFAGATGSLVLNANAGTPIPTVGPMGMAALALLLAGAAILVLRLRN